MRSALGKLKKLRGRSLDELKVRGAQLLSARAERLGLSASSRVPADAEFFKLLDPSRLAAPPASLTAESLLEHFRARTSPRFFPSFERRAETAGLLRARFGEEWPARLVERAERIVRSRFDLLGLRDLSFGEPVDWHLEPVARRRAPLVHWSRVRYLDPRVAGDKKIVWELNRHQHFVTLGRAYWLTGDERFAETFAAHLASWTEANPPKLGINWASSLEVAFRSVAWLWALHLFKDSPHLSPALFLRALKFLHLQARHVETYLSTYFSPNTHLTGEALGLFYAGTLLPELRDAARWRATGRRTLLEQLPRHVLADGVYFERSSYYHRYTADFYLHLLVLARANGEELGGEVGAAVEKMLDHLMHVTRPDGTATLYGDDDGGRFVPLDERPANDFRAALSAGAALFGRADYKHVARECAEETLWLLGPEGVRDFDALAPREPAERARAFEQGGYYCARDRWAEDASYLFVDCGPHGAVNAAHAHADALSFEFAARGRTLLVDPGTYTYTGDARARDHFRSTAAHNALVVDGEPSSVPAGPFSWRSGARATARRWLNAARLAFFEGEQDGFARLDSPAAHARSFLFLRDDYVVVRDRVETDGEHRYELYFHLAPDARPEIEAHGASVRAGGSPGLTLRVLGAKGEWRVREGWVSSCYGARERAGVCVFSAAGRGAQEFYTFLLPGGDARGRAPRAYETGAESGRCFVVEFENMKDVLLVSPPGPDAACAGVGYEARAGWAWLRESGDAPQVCREWVLIGGSSLARAGRSLFSARAEVACVAARRENRELILEIEGGSEFEVETGGAPSVTVNGRGFDAGGAEVLQFRRAGDGYEVAGARPAAVFASASGEEAYVRD